MTTYDLSSLIAHLYSVRQQKSDLEKTEKSLLAEIKPLVDTQFDEADIPLSHGGFVMTRSVGTSRTISADLLLEQGVDADTIVRATRTSTYYQYRIKEQK